MHLNKSENVKGRVSYLGAIKVKGNSMKQTMAPYNGNLL